jgi:uncharacterized protein (TIGR02452 family)
MSSLYACIAQDRARLFYDDNRAAQSALVTGHIILSEDVPFFRDEELAWLSAPWPATVITCAAPNLTWLLATTDSGLEPRTRYDELPALFARRTLLVMEAARQAAVDALVLGPWGCGAFGNDPDVVAEAFVSAVQPYGDAFDHIVFSTWGPVRNREAFEARFGPSLPGHRQA